MTNTPTKKYFVDTEFHEHRKPIKFLGITIARAWTIDLISIGIVCEDGREYYAINRDLNLRHARRDRWLRENVLDKLPPKLPLYPRSGSPTLWQKDKRWLPMKQIRQEIIDFCGGQPDIDEGGSFYRYDNGKPVFYGYYCDYDWVVFCWLFGRMTDLPNGFPMYCVDLKQMIDETVDKYYLTLGEATGGKQMIKDREATREEKLNWFKSLPSYPQQDQEHNAIADARWTARLYDFIKSIPEIKTPQ